jgi:hypothetical protein
MRHHTNSLTSFAEWATQTPLFRKGVNAGPRLGEGLIHKAPRIPTMIDDHEVDPRAVYDFQGQPLITVLDADALDEKMLHVFSTPRLADEYVNAREAPAEKAESQREVRRRNVSGLVELTPGVPPFYGFFEMYDLDGLGGCYWRILEWENLTFNYNTKWACGFLAWGWISADNNVSSIDSYVSADQIRMFNLPNLAGSSLFVPTGNFRINSLGAFGWDNRISSQLAVYL